MAAGCCAARFGPFGNPFTPDGRPGRFSGSVRIELQKTDGTLVASGPASDLDLEVLPSLLIERLAPLDTECSAPALRVLAGPAYRLEVRAVGIKPIRFEYSVTGVNARDGLSTFVHDFSETGPVASDTLGDDEAILFDPVGEDAESRVSLIRIVAYDGAGRSVRDRAAGHRPPPHRGQLWRSL